MKDKILDWVKPIFWFNDDNINDDAALWFQAKITIMYYDKIQRISVRVLDKR